MSELDKIILDGVEYELSGGGGTPNGLTYYGDITVKRSSTNQLVPSFPVVAGRSMVAFYYDVSSNAYAILFASFSNDATKYNYGYIGSVGRSSNSANNYGVTADAEFMSPIITNAVSPQWIEGELTTTVPLYLVDILS